MGMRIFRGRSPLPGLPSQEDVYAQLEPHLVEVDSSARAWQMEVLRGWTGIVRDLHLSLVELNPNYQIAQVKEKFGSLRFYAGGFDGRGESLIRLAQERSAVTCEHCGRAGKTYQGPMILTLCWACALSEKAHDVLWRIYYPLKRLRWR